jgi:hypothetical protein
MASEAGAVSARTPVLLLKTRSSPTDAYEDLFSAPRDDGSQYEPIFVPVLQHQFEDEGMRHVRKVLRDRQISNHAGSQYGGIIFTSQRAVEAFAKLVDEGKGQLPHPVPPYCRLHETQSQQMPQVMDNGRISRISPSIVWDPRRHAA